MASARNLCQHSDADGTQCTSNDYVLCPHCQLQLCLKHINAHQTLLRADLDLLCDQMNCVRANLDNLIFDSTDRRTELFQRLDDWYHERVAFLNRTYAEKKQQLHVLCIQASLEFDGYRAKKEKEFKENLSNQLRRVCRQKQIHIDDLNDMKVKLNTIERGLDELKQLLIDVQPVQASLDIQILKRRYVEAAKPSFDGDDEDNLPWEGAFHETPIVREELSHSPRPSSPVVSSSPPYTPTCSSPTVTIIKKAPLKLIIKRLQQPATTSTTKYKLHTASTPTALTT